MLLKSYCKLCGKPYMRSHGEAKYCSDECKKEATRQRQKAWREAHPDYHREYMKARKGAEASPND